MIKYRKSEILLMIASLSEINNKLLKHTILEEILESLNQLQTIALKLGTNIETYHKEEESISLLEQYCDYIYHLGESFENNNQKNNIIKKIDKLLTKLNLRIKYHIPEDKKEIVFFPYKASMWDSMESVWKEAVKDEHFDVFVVPIPYYDKHPDGSLGEMHYEAEDFPDYVNLSYWEDYNTEFRKPDIIYIHNPYDQLNLVTSVHPDFYALHLKEYTNMLVYLPYYVAAEKEDIIETGGIEHITTCGILYSNYIIVQSAFVKEAFIKLIKILAQKRGQPELIPAMSNKFLPLGSPKFDKVLSLKKEEYSLPETYKRSIYKENETKRKIILYNTSIFQFLYNVRQSIEKIRTVIEYIQNNENYVLWWRPHPLLKSTIRSIHPNMLEYYESVVQYALETKTVIYDDSSELYRAIALSDAYYGDNNSISELYKRTEKPVTIAETQNPAMECSLEDIIHAKNSYSPEGYEMAGPLIHKTICEKINI